MQNNAIMSRLPTVHLLCREIADCLKVFAGQELIFHEWRKGPDRVDLAFVQQVLHPLRQFDPMSGRLNLHDTSGQGCVLGPEEYFRQKDEAEDAMRRALSLVTRSDESPKAAYKRIWAVLEFDNHYRALVDYYERAVAKLAKAGLGTRQLDVGPKPDAVRELEEYVSVFIEAELAKVVLDSVSAEDVDKFFRKLYELCEAKRDISSNHRLSWDPFKDFLG